MLHVARGARRRPCEHEGGRRRSRAACADNRIGDEGARALASEFKHLVALGTPDLGFSWIYFENPGGAMKWARSITFQHGVSREHVGACGNMWEHARVP